MSQETEFVSVPKSLLQEVLDTAESDSYSTQSEFALSSEGEPYEAHRAKIGELRRLAGIASGEVVGQGFFGILLALDEREKP